MILIASLTGGGAGRVAAALSRHLAEAGDEVCLLTMQDAGRDFYRLDPRVRRASLGLVGATRGIAKLTANLRRLRALRREIRLRRPEVVVGFMTSDAVLSILACAGLPARAIVSERNNPGRKPVPAIWRLLRWASYRFADSHVAQTREAADWLTRHTGARNVHVIPNSVAWPIAALPPPVAPDALLPRGAKLLLSVGSKPGQKGFDLLVEAFSRLAGRFPDWVLAIPGIAPSSAGASPETGALIRQIAAHGLQHRVLLPGHVGNIGEWYQRAELFVLSSRYEGIPNALLEAMASGTACIAFDCRTRPDEIISHGEDGLLVPAEDVDDLAVQMASLMADRQRRRQLAARDRKSVV